MFMKKTLNFHKSIFIKEFLILRDVIDYPLQTDLK